MKKSEAREKWCPMVRYNAHTNDSGGCNRHGANSSVPDFALCVADLCMMWREDGKKRGYCGLAGVLI